MKKFGILLLLLVGSVVLHAQQKGEAQTSPLYREIAHMDSVLFNAVNTRDLETIKKVFAENIEFYHDLGGVSNYTQNIETFATNFAKNNGLRRELVPGSMEVYPIKDFGAVQIAAHQFCHPENGKMDCGTFRFVHLWQKKEGVWKITRIISYGH